MNWLSSRIIVAIAALISTAVASGRSRVDGGAPPSLASQEIAQNGLDLLIRNQVDSESSLVSHARVARSVSSFRAADAFNGLTPLYTSFLYERADSLSRNSFTGSSGFNGFNGNGPSGTWQISGGFGLQSGTNWAHEERMWKAAEAAVRAYKQRQALHRNQVSVSNHGPPVWKRIFASYSHIDKARVLPILKLMEAAGACIFCDTAIQPGEKWRAVLEKHLGNCDVLMVFWSAAASASAEVEREWNQGMTLKLAVVPVLLDATELPEPLKEYQWVDLAV